MYSYYECRSVGDLEDIAELIDDEKPEEVEVLHMGEWLLYCANIFIARDEDDNLVGFIVLIKKPKEVALLEVVYVSKDHRQQGIGNKLVQMVLNKCKDKVDIVLYAEQEKAHLTKFYENLGFENRGISYHTSYYFDTCNIFYKEK